MNVFAAKVKSIANRFWRFVGAAIRWFSFAPDKWHDNRPMFLICTKCNGQTFAFWHDGTDASRRKCCEIVSEMIDDPECALDRRTGMAIVGCVSPVTMADSEWWQKVIEESEIGMGE